MRVVEIDIDLGPAASIEVIEGLVRGFRVASELAYETEVVEARRNATEAMKFPTEDELIRAAETIPEQFRDRVNLHIYALHLLRGDLGQRLEQGDTREQDAKALFDAGYGRFFLHPLARLSDASLDVIDPPLYQALVAQRLRDDLPSPLAVRGLRYENPFWLSMLGKGKAEKTASAFTNVVETIRDYDADQRIAVVEAQVAEATAAHRIEESAIGLQRQKMHLNQEAQQAMLDAERQMLEIDREHLQLRALRLAVDEREQRQRLMYSALANGNTSLAAQIAQLTASDARALDAVVEAEQLEIEMRDEPDE